MIEAELHNLIKNRLDIQKKLCEILEIEGKNIEFVSEDQFPNSLMVDFTIISDGKVKALVELKGDNIGVNDFVRGTGQVYQYQNFIDLKQSLKHYIYDEACSVYLFPSDIISLGKFNIGLMSYPDKCKIVEYNPSNEMFRVIEKKELDILAGDRGKQVATISQYYIRDTRLYELFIALKYICDKEMLGMFPFDRKQMEKFLKQLDVPDKGNWRNVFISLSSLGLTDSGNRPTDKGMLLGTHTFGYFAEHCYTNYIKPYIDVLQTVLMDLNAQNVPISLDDIGHGINLKFGNQEVLFLTDSDNRYLSSWLNIMKDDFNCIDFKKNKAKRTYRTLYVMSEYNSKAIIRHVDSNAVAKLKIDDFMELFARSYMKGYF